MAVTKIRKFSSWTLVVCAVISIIVLAIFYFGGVVDEGAEKKEPVFTSLLLYWTYALVALTIVALLIFGVFQFVESIKNKPKAALGSLIVIVIFVALLGITYWRGDTTALKGINTDSAHFNTDFWLKLSDMWLYTTYTLLGLCILAMIASSVKNILKK